MDLKQFLELFNPYPGNHYMLVTDEVDEISTALYDLIKAADGELSIVHYGDTEIELGSDLENAQLQNIKTYKQPYRALPRTYDMVVFKDIFHKHENQKGVLNIAYTSLANAAHIIIMQKKGTMNIDETLSLLEELEFRAQNSIDLLPEYDLVIAKKLHMWGKGL